MERTPPPPADARLPLDARLTGLEGRTTSFGDPIGGRPADVVFADCQLRSPILALAGIALGKSGLKAGTDYRLVVIGFNPRATGAHGDHMVDGQIGFSSPVGRATTAVLAREVVATHVTSAVGFHYVYDPDLGRFAHPAALLVVSGDCRLSRVLPGLAITGTDVRLALVEVGKDTIGALTDQMRPSATASAPRSDFMRTVSASPSQRPAPQLSSPSGPACSRSRDRPGVTGPTG